MKPYLLLPLFWITTLPAFAGPFTIEPVRGNLTAKWQGDAGAIVAGAPTDEDIAALASNTELHTIEITGNTTLTGKGFAALKDLPKLRVIRLGGTGPSRFSEVFQPGTLEGYHALAQLPQVETLIFDHVKVSTEGAEIVLKGMKGLKNFSIGTCADDRILQAATQSQSLTTISFGHWPTIPDAKLTMTGIAAVARIPNLENIGLGSLGASDGTPAEVFALLAQAKNLKSLAGAFVANGKKFQWPHAQDSKVTVNADALAPLATMSKLKGLSFENISFAADAFSPLKAHATLEYVQLWGCDVATGALLPLAQLPNLKGLVGHSLGYSQAKADPAEIAAIKAANPKLSTNGF